jgi:hypothetical protein
LDFRQFAQDTLSFSSDNDQRTIPETFKHLPKTFPGIRCILLDNHAEVDPASLISAYSQPCPSDADDSHTNTRPLLLSLADGHAHLSSNFYTSNLLRGLIYLDVSGLPGSLKPLATAVAQRQYLPNLKIFCAKRREIDDSTAISLFQAFGRQLWSIDLGENNFGDLIVDALLQFSFDAVSLRSEARFVVEGKIQSPRPHGTNIYGPFKFITESEKSASFTHEERYFVDSPQYFSDPHSHPQDGQVRRLDGHSPVKWSTVEHVKKAMAGNMQYFAPDASTLLHLDICNAPLGITHLCLSNTNLTSFGLEKLIRLSSGQLENLACDSVLFQPVGVVWPPPWPKGTKIKGILGSTHVFRPVFSSNLRVLRIHHSLVTQTPTLEAQGLSTLAALYIAETEIRSRSEMAFPQSFVPDMNPRITSLTLTNIPRRSTGPLASKLISFLKLVAFQERAILDATVSSSRHSPAMLKGLRHIRLEFESDPLDDPAGLSMTDDLDAGDLMSMDEEGFSFFDTTSGARVAQPRGEPLNKAKESRGSYLKGVSSISPSDSGIISRVASPESGRQCDNPAGGTEELSEFVKFKGRWNNNVFNSQVWTGSQDRTSKPAVKEYARILSDLAFHDNIGPATPAHVLAGAPEGGLLYYTAWDSMVMPRELKKPSATDLARMVDVVGQIKAYRQATRQAYLAQKRDVDVKSPEPRRGPLFWTGNLEVAVQESNSQYHSSSYWR